jgi:hypothetical protein
MVIFCGDEDKAALTAEPSVGRSANQRSINQKTI